jgi:hypothetical protein
MYNWSKTIDFYTAVETYSVKQDTTVNTSNSTPIVKVESLDKDGNIIQKDSTLIRSIPQIDFSAIDSILLKSEEREKQIQEQQAREAAIQRWYKRKVDTSEVLYKQFGIAGFPIKEKLDLDQFQQNFLYNINSVKPEEKEIKQTVFIENEEEAAVNVRAHTKSLKENTEIKPKYIPREIEFDWITIVLIASFLLLGWIRLFNKKYLGSLLKSSVSFQESNTLYREKNSLTERASFMLNLLFFSNVSVFVIQLKHFFKIDLPGVKDSMLYFIVVGALISLYVFRAISSSFIGFVFLKQKVFSEYFHNVNLFTKNTGLYLLPLVIILQFLTYEYLAFIVYVGIAIASILYLLQLVRSFQIINRKNVSIFYMILYLCAFEFAPFLIIYKVLVSLA